jgi:hypothetical protein
MRPIHSYGRDTSRRLTLIAVYLIGWAASVLGAPAFAMLAGDAHDVSFIRGGGQTRIVLHHDSHSASKAWDTFCGHPAGEAKCADHPDHEFHFVDQNNPAILKSVPLSLLSAAVTAVFSAAVVSKPAVQPPPAPSISPPRSVLRILSTIVLLI